MKCWESRLLSLDVSVEWDGLRKLRLQEWKRWGATILENGTGSAWEIDKMTVTTILYRASIWSQALNVCVYVHTYMYVLS